MLLGLARGSQTCKRTSLMLSLLAAITPALGLDYCKKQCGEVDKKSPTIQEQRERDQHSKPNEEVPPFN
jgi:hypothetical protein